ncbi:hypothetical protein [Thermosipho sp. (in: thermotogales)]|jgi:hypothetical protein|uniref:hypothetical protein n=1 Tax=Thermosipho sp. (in: thermotogales) TaxID=1968895 RepID=UPI00257C7002|nr:hypothetical protein [Thermosipho sp. (in: thermotogales)]MBZ4649145.1 hypothetical protein [Thermosipho sp. (in: thermotogales)]
MSEINSIIYNTRSIIIQITASFVILVLTFCGLLFIAGREHIAWKQISNTLKGVILIGIAPALASLFLMIAKIK